MIFLILCFVQNKIGLYLHPPMQQYPVALTGTARKIE